MSDQTALFDAPVEPPRTHVEFLVAFFATWVLGPDAAPRKAERAELERIARHSLRAASDLRRSEETR